MRFSKMVSPPTTFSLRSSKMSGTMVPFGPADITFTSWMLAEISSSKEAGDSGMSSSSSSKYAISSSMASSRSWVSSSISPSLLCISSRSSSISA